MANVTNIQAPTPPAPTGQAPVSPATTTANASVTAVAASAQPVDNDTSISPRIIVDPLAGEIIQFLSNTGQVQSQIPSSTVVAYLRAGLTSQGLSRPQTEPHQTTTNA